MEDGSSETPTGWGALDISLKITLGLAGAGAAAAAIALPNKSQKERAALDLFDKSWGRLTPQEHKVAEFSAGYRRWTDFFETKVYPTTRKLPGEPVHGAWVGCQPEQQLWLCELCMGSLCPSHALPAFSNRCSNALAQSLRHP